jgi:CRISPR/Cas system-associated exonuclease Cas4 (RecB family)
MIRFNRLHKYHKLPRSYLDTGERFYIDLDGNPLFSVTTILGSTADKAGLIEWQNRVGEEEANRIRNEAAGLGTLMHTHLEHYILGQERPTGKNLVHVLARNMADQVINRGLVNVSEVWGLEESLYYPGLYAGTADLIGIHNGSPAIMDYKTANKMKRLDHITDYLLQISAYAIAHNEVYGTDISKGVIYMVDRNLQFKEFVIEGSDFRRCESSWLMRVERFMTEPVELA